MSALAVVSYLLEFFCGKNLFHALGFDVAANGALLNNQVCDQPIFNQRFELTIGNPLDLGTEKKILHRHKHDEGD
jgi:hypothetical protein